MAKKDLIPMRAHLIPESERSVETLIKIFGERVEDVDENIRERLTQYIGYIKAKRPDDWFEWALRGIAQVATKVTKEQRSIAYLLGIYKSWLNYGFGTFRSAEQEKMYEIFKQRFGIEPSPAALEKLEQLVNDWGLVFTTAAVMNVSSPEIQDISLSIVNACEAYMERNYKPIELKRIDD